MMYILRDWMIKSMENQEKKQTWIKVFRGIENSWLWKEKPFSRGQAWIDLLLLAKFRDEKFMNRRGNLIDGKRGHVYRSVSSLAERWGWSRRKVDHFFNQLESDNMIKVNKKRASEETSIFIVNYGSYQVIGASKRTSQEQVRNKWSTSQEQVEHIYKNDKECIKNDKEKKEGPAALSSSPSQQDEEEGIDLFNMSDEEYEEMKRKIENGDIRI